MITFALPRFEYLLPRESGDIGQLRVERFPNQELSLSLETDVGGEACLLVGSVAPPDEQLLSLLLAADTLQRHGAADITALLPYLGYARQDLPEPQRALGIAWIGRLLSACGVQRVVTIDVHSPDAARMLGLTLRSLSAARLFASVLRRSDLLDAVVVAPDEGAIGRCRAVAGAAGIDRPVAFLQKERTPGGVVHGELVGEVGRRVAVVDDILDTGGTLVSCCHELAGRGVEEITVMVTHGLFTGASWQELPSLGVARIWVTDSIPSAAKRAGKLVATVSVRPLIEQAVHEASAGPAGGSVSVA